MLTRRIICRSRSRASKYAALFANGDDPPLPKSCKGGNPPSKLPRTPSTSTTPIAASVPGPAVASIDRRRRSTAMSDAKPPPLPLGLVPPRPQVQLQ
jgi:hypothetical protein